MKADKKWQILNKLVRYQGGFVLMMTLVFYFAAGKKSAISAFLGGMVCVLPQFAFVLQAFKHQGARFAREIVKNFYKAEAFKIILSIVLFAIVFIIFDISPMAFFLTFIAAQAMQWLTPWLIFNKQKRSESD